MLMKKKKTNESPSSLIQPIKLFDVSLTESIFHEDCFSPLLFLSVAFLFFHLVKSNKYD